ncbi:unnamed protein product [Phaedon cochleariae]|uniref:Transcription initiation factor TFIID subunit 6 n=1 Tax=Phaedon cochleariae TaxID=80249 RepID=A0A9P0DNK2_PHACE|nr:unnamed protein product [Phaedon cochleariae]
MKSTQVDKLVSSNNTQRLRKNSKDREKRKSQTGSSENNSNDKNSPTKDAKQYAGISSESIFTYAEQSSYEHLSDEVCDTLAEDINYKLRYIIHDALTKARLCGRDAISSTDIEETFKNLSIEKVYGAPNAPNWVHSGDFGDQSFLYLNDTKVNLIEIAENESAYCQHKSISLTKKWLPDPELLQPSQLLKNYFTTICHTVISEDVELRQMALRDISENPRIGPIIEWFYHFAYFLLIKNVTYDCLTDYALDLVETLENSPLGFSNVSEVQIKLLVRLLLQRLLLFHTSKDVLKNMCSVLAVICLRAPLRHMAIAKISQKLRGIEGERMLAILTTIYYLGIDAVREVFLPNIKYFLEAVVEKYDPDLVYVTLAIYGLLCKADYNDNYIHKHFDEAVGNSLVMFWKPIYSKIDKEKLEVNFIGMKTQLIKTRRKLDCWVNLPHAESFVDEVFDIPKHECRVRTIILENCVASKGSINESFVTVGKTDLLFNKKKYRAPTKCCDHSFLSYNF